MVGGGSGKAGEWKMVGCPKEKFLPFPLIAGACYRKPFHTTWFYLLPNTDWKVQKEIFRWDKHCNMWTFGTRFKSRVSQSRQGGGNLLPDFPILESNVTIFDDNYYSSAQGWYWKLEIKLLWVTFLQSFVSRAVSTENRKRKWEILINDICFVAFVVRSKIDLVYLEGNNTTVGTPQRQLTLSLPRSDC